MNDKIPAIVRAAKTENLLGAALAYAELGFSVLPLKGKRPALRSWIENQQTGATTATIEAWHKAGLMQNIGIVCGAVSGNLAVLDLDGASGYPAFAATFPALAETYTVSTGGGVGKHIYWRVDDMPPAIKAMQTPIGNLEICAEGRQIVAPPSLHPRTRQPYTIYKEADILRVPSLAKVIAWVESFKTPPTVQTWQPPRVSLATSDLNPRVIEELTRHFSGLGYKQYGDWLHGRCIYPERHTNGDAKPSFGFNTRSGFGYCYRCGTMLAKDICAKVGIDPASLGGLMAGISQPLPKQIELASALQDSEPPKEEESPSIADLKLPSWLQMYLEWAGAAGNQTPMSFHLASGLWLLSVAIGRRLYGAAPWGVNLYPNLYIMMIASTTYYRKSTAYKLAEQVARAAIPHMLMPTPGSPERFQEALSGRLPANFDKLTLDQQNRLTKAQPFAAQRGLLKDEVAGLFGAINRKDYMYGVKDLIMELYDCPEYSDKDTQGGLTVVERAALSMLGVTTPAGLAAAISDADWANGLLVRFALITPEPDYKERPPLKERQEMPSALVEGLKRLHEKLPMPQDDGETTLPPGELELKVECWAEVQGYSDELRRSCKPDQDFELDERLKGVYGRMHVQAFKLASLLAALDWLDSEEPAPTVTAENWEMGRQVAELWRQSAHRLLERIDRSAMAQREQGLQQRMLEAFRQGGESGRTLREVYRQLHLPAKQARQIADDLVLAGLLVKVFIDGAEGYLLHVSRHNGRM
jgi:hypothetical protein